MRTRSFWVRSVVFLALAGSVAAAIAYRGRFDLGRIEQDIQFAGAWAPVAYMGLYVLATVVFLPGSILSLSGGALFGPVAGTVYTLIGATIGAACSFLIARYIASDWVRAKAGPRLTNVIEGVEAEGWRFVAFTRLIPLFPFNLLNYALGLTRVGFFPYLISSLFCMIPGAIAYTYLGYAGREAAAGNSAAVQKGIFGLGLLAAIVYLPRLIRLVRKRRVDWVAPARLKAKLASNEPPMVLDVRGADEYCGQSGHLKDARNIPVSELPNRIAELESLRDRELVLVCKTHRRSVRGAAILKEAGFRRVAVLRGGMVEWDKHGFPVRTGD